MADEQKPETPSPLDIIDARIAALKQHKLDDAARWDAMIKNLEAERAALVSAP